MYIKQYLNKDTFWFYIVKLVIYIVKLVIYIVKLVFYIVKLVFSIVSCEVHTDS